MMTVVPMGIHGCRMEIVAELVPRLSRQSVVVRLWVMGSSAAENGAWRLSDSCVLVALKPGGGLAKHEDTVGLTVSALELSSAVVVVFPI